MDMPDFAHEDFGIAESSHAEQSVLAALLIDNDAIDHITHLKPEHFYHFDNRRVFEEACKQIANSQRCDVISLMDALNDAMPDCLRFLHQIAQTAASVANIGRYAEIIIDKAMKRALVELGRELEGKGRSPEPAAALIDEAGAKLEALTVGQVKQDPVRMSSMLSNYVDVIQSRIAGEQKAIETGFTDLDRLLDGGLERGTLTVLAARPGMGKTAMALALARNVATWGTSLFLSMEMSAMQCNDRNIAALGGIPVAWLRRPNETDNDKWDRFTAAIARADKMNLFIDDQTALNMLEIRAKARYVKRRQGLDMLVVDQLSFITGSKVEKQWEAVGDYTRGLMRIAKEQDIAVVLLAQLNRKCDERNDKRPVLSDLAMSGSIEQDAANVLFLYRDEIYNLDSMDKGICEVIVAKQRQGSPGMVGLTFIANQTRFENLNREFAPERRALPKSRMRSLE